MVCTKIRPLWSMVTEFIADKFAIPNIYSPLILEYRSSESKAISMSIEAATPAKSEYTLASGHICKKSSNINVCASPRHERHLVRVN